MIDSTLYHRLSPIARRVQMRRAFLWLAGIWSITGLAGLALWWMKSSLGWFSWPSLIAFLAVTSILTLTGLWLALRHDDNFVRTARRIERRFPELNSSLVTAIEQQPASPAGTLGYLQSEVVRRAVYHGYQHGWHRIVPQWQLVATAMLSLISLALLLVSTGGQFFSAAADMDIRRMMSGLGNGLPGDNGEIDVQPGDTEVEKGSSLLVLARFGNDTVPGDVELVYRDPSGAAHELDMPRSLQDPVFGVRIPVVDAPMSYHVRYDQRQSRDFTVEVFEYPELVQADALITPPSWSADPVKIVENVRRITALQDSRLELKLQVNKPVASARLIASGGQQFELTASADDPCQLACQLAMLASDRYELELLDDQQRKNQEPPVFTINVLDNQRPKIKIDYPTGDVQVSALEEIDITASVWDDSGVLQAGVSWTSAGGESGDQVLAESVAAGSRQELAHTLALEELAAQPDDLLTFYLWAEDVGPDGAPRRTESDLHFVEVRAFDEVFRQGQQPAGGSPPPGGPGGQGGRSDELIDLQKQIINATWNLIRRERISDNESSFIEDVATVSRSQASVMEQLQSGLQEMADEQAQVAGDEALLQMKLSIEQLDQARQNQEPQPLDQAVHFEQAAYAALLKLREREHEVARSQQNQGSGGGQNSRSRRQLDQLRLENDENRYQTEQQAQEQTETRQQREDRQILSRLRELARRQNDLNQRIRELQSSLEEARTEQEKQELNEQLKRLQGEQEQILRDAEELQQRMQQPGNQSRMSEQTQQLDQARENIQESNQALQQGDVPDSAARGTRAERQLRELRDEFQQQASGQFDDQIQQMRNEARDIEAEQQEISEALTEKPDEGARSLSDETPRDDLTRRLQRQEQRVRELEQEMRDLVVDSEEIEPIMAERLYDTWRRSRQAPPDDALQSTAQSLARGFVDDARIQNEQASEGIRQLREGIDSAAEAVLGDETEALRRANQQLQRLSAEVQNESRRARGDTGPESRSDERGDPTMSSTEDGPEPSGNRAADDSEPSTAGAEAPEDADPGAQASATDGKNPPPGGSQTDGRRGTGQSDEQSREPPAGEPSSPAGPPSGTQRPADSRPDAGPPSLNNRNRQDARGTLGASPQLNYDNAEEWLDPLGGDDYLNWSDRLRDVEEMVADPELRAEASRIREEARTIRGEVRRHSRPPNWDLVELKVIRPLVELQDRVHEELLRRSGQQLLVPIDRDPVPPEFEDAVRQYYERLGRGQ